MPSVSYRNFLKLSPFQSHLADRPVCRVQYYLPADINFERSYPCQMGNPILQPSLDLISPDSDIAEANLDSTFAIWTRMKSSGLSGEPSRTILSSDILITLCLAVKSALTKFTNTLEMGSMIPLVIMARRSLVSRSSGALAEAYVTFNSFHTTSSCY